MISVAAAISSQANRHLERSGVGRGTMDGGAGFAREPKRAGRVGVCIFVAVIIKSTLSDVANAGVGAAAGELAWRFLIASISSDSAVVTPILVPAGNCLVYT